MRTRKVKKRSILYYSGYFLLLEIFSRKFSPSLVRRLNGFVCDTEYSVTRACKKSVRLYLLKLQCYTYWLIKKRKNNQPLCPPEKKSKKLKFSVIFIRIINLCFLYHEFIGYKWIWNADMFWYFQLLQHNKISFMAPDIPLRCIRVILKLLANTNYYWIPKLTWIIIYI